MSINSIYDIPVFIINMPNRTDRKEHMTKLMEDLGFTKYSFIEPYKANEETKLLFEKLIGKETTLTLTKISHNMTYLNLLQKEDEQIIILEDDIILTQNLKDTKKDLEYIYINSPKDATMIYMEMCFERCDNISNEKFVKLIQPMCAASIYYPSKNYRHELYKKFLKLPISNQHAIDGAFAHFIKIKDINAYMYKLLFIQDSNFGSDLEGSAGYKTTTKPVLPICKKYTKNMEYLDKNKYINRSVKNMFEADIKKNWEYLKQVNYIDKNMYKSNMKNVKNNKNYTNYLDINTIIISLILFLIFILTIKIIN